MLSFFTVQVTTDDTSLQFAGMARDYGAGNKTKLKAPDNLLLQALRTSLGGNARTFAYASLRPSQSDATVELMVKSLGALAKIKDAADSKEFKVDVSGALTDDGKWAAAVAKGAEAAAALWCVVVTGGSGPAAGGPLCCVFGLRAAVGGQEEGVGARTGFGSAVSFVVGGRIEEVSVQYVLPLHL